MKSKADRYGISVPLNWLSEKDETAPGLSLGIARSKDQVR